MFSFKYSPRFERMLYLMAFICRRFSILFSCGILITLFSLTQLLLIRHSRILMILNTFMFLFQVCLSSTESSSVPVSPPVQYTNCNQLLLVPERDEQLALYALIARAAADTTIPFLSQLFSERFARLNQVFFLASFNFPQLLCSPATAGLCIILLQSCATFVTNILLIFLAAKW